MSIYFAHTQQFVCTKVNVHKILVLIKPPRFILPIWLYSLTKVGQSGQLHLFMRLMSMTQKMPTRNIEFMRLRV